MTRVWSQFLGAFLLTVLTAGGIYTTSYFFDTEMGDPNTLAATSLDGIALGEPFDDLLCLFGGTTEKEFTFTNNNMLPFMYDVSAENISGSGCGNIQLTAFRNGGEVYSGDIGGFALSGFPLAPGDSDTWGLTVDYLLGATSTADTLCTFDTRFAANQESFMSGEAFYDIETLSHTITATTDTGTSTECEPPGETVDLQMDKHISGDSAGFEESDFSFRITGDGVNAVVPHGGSIALPIGTYTIEELVPEGFDKGDWRIGWYGECEAGDEFTTTITIDEGNVDHGWLDCQADNQYRPELNKEEETSGTTEIYVSRPRDDRPDRPDGRRSSRSGSQQQSEPEATVAGTATSSEEEKSTTTPNQSSSEDTSGQAEESKDEPETVLIETVSENEAKKKEEEEPVEEDKPEEPKEEEPTEEPTEEQKEEEPTEESAEPDQPADEESPQETTQE